MAKLIPVQDNEKYLKTKAGNAIFGLLPRFLKRHQAKWGIAFVSSLLGKIN